MEREVEFAMTLTLSAVSILNTHKCTAGLLSCSVSLLSRPSRPAGETSCTLPAVSYSRISFE